MITYTDYNTKWEQIRYALIVKSECFFSCIADEKDDPFVDTFEYEHIKDDDVNRFSTKEINKRLEHLPKGIALAVKCRQ